MQAGGDYDYELEPRALSFEQPDPMDKQARGVAGLDLSEGMQELGLEDREPSVQGGPIRGVGLLLSDAPFLTPPRQVNARSRRLDTIEEIIKRPHMRPSNNDWWKVCSNLLCPLFLVACTSKYV